MDFKTNSNFNIANTSSHEEFDDNYILIYKDMNNILDDIGLQGDERILCKSIIENLEKKLVLIYEKINVLLFLILVLFKRIGIVPNLLVIIKILKKLEKL